MKGDFCYIMDVFTHFTKKIFINPGHYPGVDSGATYGAYTEAELAALVATDLRDLLVNAGYNVMYLQSDNLGGDSPDYPDIVTEANNFLDDGMGWALSIHLNSAASCADGTEWLTYGDGESIAIAENLRRVWLNTHAAIYGDIFVDRGVKDRPNLIFCRDIEAPSVLAEIGFINSEHDLDVIVNQRPHVIRALYLAIVAARHDGELCEMDEGELAALSAMGSR